MATKRRRVDGAFVSRFAAEERVKDIRHLYPAHCAPRVVQGKRVRAKGSGYRTWKVTVSAGCPSTSHPYGGVPAYVAKRYRPITNKAAMRKMRGAFTRKVCARGVCVQKRRL